MSFEESSRVRGIMQEDDIRVDIFLLRLDRGDPSIRTCENNVIR